MSEASSSGASLPVPSMHAPPAIPERLVARATRGADKLLLAVMRRVFVTNDDPRLEAEFEQTVERLKRYTDPELLAHPERLLAPADPLPALKVERREPLRATKLWGQPRARLQGLRELGIDEHLSFQTPYAPLDSVYAQEYAGYPELERAHLFSWRHLDPAPATILMTHGWGVGPWFIHRREYDVPYLFYELGLDVYFYQAPYHARRKPQAALVSGQLHPSPDLVRTNEAFIQTAIELRTIISMIEQRNAAPLGMMGSSLGGYTSALLASIDERLDFVIPILPPASMAHVLWDHGDDDPLRARAEAMGMSRERFHNFWALHSPLSHAPKVPWGRRMLITGLGDTVVQERHTRDLWEHWERPRHFRFPGGHAWQVQRRRYQREIGRFLGELGLTAPR